MALTDADGVQKVVIFYVDATQWTRNQQFLFCSAVVLISSFLYDYLLELIMVEMKMGNYTWIVSGIQFSGYSVISFVESRALGKKIGRKIPISLLLMLGLSSVVTIGFSNNALKHINYPTQVIFKSCKLVPVMIGGVVILRKRYEALDVAACILMSLGLTAFTLVGSKLSPNFHHLGVVMMVTALAADAVVGNFQEKAMKVHGASSAEVMCSSFAVAACLVFGYLLVTGYLSESVSVLVSRRHLWLPVAGLVVAGYVSVGSVLVLVRQFDALVAVAVTNLRKVFSLVISFLAFSKPFSVHYVWSGALVAVGVYLNVFSKRLRSQHEAPELPTMMVTSKKETQVV